MTTFDPPPLSRGTFDRDGIHRGNEAWLAQAWTQARVLLLSPRSSTPVTAHGTPDFRASADTPTGPRRYLGLVEDVPVFTVVCEPDSADWKSLREIGDTCNDLDASLFATAIGLEQWHQKHTHCSRCGTATVETQAGWTRTCPADDSQHFPRTDPAVIMLITDNSPGRDLALLGRGHQWGEGRFSTLAGFVEPGESLEGAVAREVFEEVGVHIHDVRYLASQPWPFPASLMLGFVARLDGDPSITLDPVEIAEAGWFTRDEVRRAADWTDDIETPQGDDNTVALRAIPPHFSISRYLIDRWLANDIETDRRR